jgi:hypothetical protein
VTPVEAAYAALSPRDWTVYRKAMRVRCPWCKAPAGKACTTMGLVLTLGHKVHPRRVEAAS